VELPRAVAGVKRFGYPMVCLRILFRSYLLRLVSYACLVSDAPSLPPDVYP
jgi:hypothetical protein